MSRKYRRLTLYSNINLCETDSITVKYYQCCCQGLETQGQGQGLHIQGRGQGQGVKLQGQGQGLGPVLIHTFLVGTEQEVMSLVVYCRSHVTDKQRSVLDSCMPKSLDLKILVTSLTKERRS